MVGKVSVLTVNRRRKARVGSTLPTGFIFCPICEDGGCVDDYWFSADTEDELNDIMAEGFLDGEV